MQKLPKLQSSNLRDIELLGKKRPSIYDPKTKQQYKYESMYIPVYVGLLSLNVSLLLRFATKLLSNILEKSSILIGEIIDLFH